MKAAFITPTLPNPLLRPRRTGTSPLRRPRAPRASLDPIPAVAAVHSLPPLALAASTPLLQLGKLLAGPAINVFNFTMIVRIILSWYPKADLAKVPWIFIAVPTEPLLRATREVIKPVGGVDISPIVWFAVMSLVHELLVGPQGILVLLEMK